VGCGGNCSSEFGWRFLGKAIISRKCLRATAVKQLSGRAICANRDIKTEKPPSPTTRC